MPATTAVGTTLTSIAKIRSCHYEFLGFQIINGDVPLNAFEVQGRMHPEGAWVTLKNGSFTQVTGFAPAWATTELATLGAGVSALLYVLGKHTWEIRLRASVASGTSSVMVYANYGGFNAVRITT